MSEDGVGDVPAVPMYVLQAAAELRFVRPDLTGALASHLSDVAVAAADRDGWLAAAGWRVHAAAAVGDGRATAVDVLDGLSHWGTDALFTAAADRLRLELAVVAHDAGDSMASLRLLAVPMTEPGPELAADAALVAARCGKDGVVGEAAFDEAAFDEAVAAWSRVGGHRGEVGASCAVLVAAALARRGGRAEKAVELAVDGLTRLDHGRIGAELAPSSHLAAALAAEWVSALIDAGRLDEARDGIDPLRVRLLERARPSRQLALLRLTIARAAACDSHDTDGDSVDQLEHAAQDAAASDVPDLEHACRTALGELYESRGRLDAALEAIRLAVAADRRHGARAVRLRTALATLSAVGTSSADRVVSDSPVAEQVTEGSGQPPSGSTEDGSVVRNGNGAGDRTTILQILRPVDAEVVAQVAPEVAADAVPRTAAGLVVEELAAGAGHVRTTDRSLERQVPARRVRTADPWVTGSWSAAETGPADRYEADDGGRRSHSGRPLLKPPVERLDAHADNSLGAPSLGAPSLGAPSLDDRPAEPGSDNWLASALAELDRVWGTATVAADTVRPSAPEPVASEPVASEPVASEPVVQECVVVLDLARAEQRLPVAVGGPTLQRVARRLVGRLPAGARLRDDAPDTLSVVLPGADRATASEWMHRALPDLADGLDVDAAASGALLRAAVHDADDVVGAQIMQRLDAHEESSADASSVDGGRDRSAPEVPTRASGKHDQSAGRPAFLPEGVIVRPGSGGRRYRRGSQPALVGVDAPKPTSESTEGLGLADLLAGALEAYRGI